MTDMILTRWWEKNWPDASRLAGESDLVRVESLHDRAPRHLVARFSCKGLVREADRRVVEADHFEVGIWIPPDYQIRADTRQVFTVLWPLNVWHPNILGPFLCAGHLHPGMSIVDLLYQVYEILTYHNFAPNDALNPDAAAWARQPDNRARFPIDRRPLKRRKLSA